LNPASFEQANLDEAVERVVQVIRTERPQVVVTYDEQGGYGHPDHIRAHQVAVGAFYSAGDPDRFPSAGPPWTPAKLYYAVIPRSEFRRFADRLREVGMELPFEPEAESEDAIPFGVSDDQVTTWIDVSAYVTTKRTALAAHRTQMGPEQWFMRLPEELFAEAFGRETFQRIAGPGEMPESDLFAGLP
jgi:LmbE family N-acetylglucosaminyl deacetylase